jgi:hypothetical protein
MSQSCLYKQTFVCYAYAMAVDKSITTKVVTYLKHLGLTSEQADVYLYLLQNGPSSVLSISRGLKTGRTKLYPLLERLTADQLVVTHERHYGTSYEAQDPNVVEFLVSEQELAANKLRSELPSILNTLSTLHSKSPATSRVVEYKGIDGLKQMNFNLTKARSQYRVFELAGLDKHLGDHFANRIRERTADKNLTTYDLTNNPNRTLEPGVGGQSNHVRYIDPKVFTIQFETFIYDNCVGLVHYDHDDIFGVEIYNQKLASQQRQIFDLLWSQAHKI